MIVIVGITGASGALYAVKLLEVLSGMKDVDVHLVVTETGEKILELEADMTVDKLRPLVKSVYNSRDLTSPLASGSFYFDSAIIIPCSMKTLAGIASGYSDNLVLRVADVALKMKRKLILVVRETPYNTIHIENMLKVSNAGGIILPASPAFYHKPRKVEDLINYIVGRVLEIIGLPHNLYSPWTGVGKLEN